jgi:hypothetical protein
LQILSLGWKTNGLITSFQLYWSMDHPKASIQNYCVGGPKIRLIPQFTLETEVIKSTLILIKDGITQVKSNQIDLTRSYKTFKAMLLLNHS